MTSSSSPTAPPTPTDLGSVREEYSRSSLPLSSLAPHPMAQFATWFAAAQSTTPPLPEPNAMCLATADPASLAPSARMVLLKAFDERGLVFYTNYASRKGRELAANPRAAAVFWWGKPLERSVRVEGVVRKVAEEESDAYFGSRPRGSQVAAAASRQSEEVESREALERRWRDVEEEARGGDVQRPKEWGGYRIEPEVVEFWKGRESRMHERFVYRRDGKGGWTITRLQP